MQQLRESPMRDAYVEIVPALSQLGQLVGRSMLAQGLVAACNATMIFIALTVFGLQHEVLLSLGVFVLCLVPTFGAIISWFLISTLALFGPGGGPILALKVTGAFAFIGFMESFVLGPRILGRMMELHPVLIIAILPVAQYFFGIWGMILATPVAVYLINSVILGGSASGAGESTKTAPRDPSAVEEPSVEPSR
jgi:predicted PurR-regulated permease PerM